jgi:YHS domain-containing protein
LILFLKHNLVQIFEIYFPLLNIIVFLGNNCSWCHQAILGAKSNEVIGTSGNVFCSENCFLQFRRASFKRAKTCDFCKNVRNAVSYVDFNDGTTQLQFCSEKCSEKYKIKIFCRETQAQLELNPHLKESNNDSGGKSNLHLI